MDVIKKLNELRLQQDMSVYRLAELSGINQSTLANTFSRGTVIEKSRTYMSGFGNDVGTVFFRG